MTPQEKQQLKDLQAQVKEMKSFITGMTGNLNFKNAVDKLAREAVVLQVADVDSGNPDTELEREVGLTGEVQTIEVMAYPDFFVFVKDKNNTPYKIPAYDITL
jgi:hypothetical protein